MKNLAIIAYSRKAVNEYRNLFEKILENRVLISTYCMEDGSIYQPIQADLAVISSDDMLPLAKKQLASGITLVTATLTISRKGFEAIQALPPRTRALMVNVNRNLSLQCVEQIYHLGATHLELIPYTPYTELHQRVDVAISPGEAWAVPASVSADCGDWQAVYRYLDDCICPDYARFSGTFPDTGRAGVLRNDYAGQLWNQLPLCEGP